MSENYFEATLRVHEKKLTQFVREQTGDDTLVVEFDRTPTLLSPEKPKRWPEDFRGFGTNVRPKNQR